MKQLTSEPKNILVINVSRIGDTLLVTPALRALAQKWPQAKITFLGHPNRAEIIENIPFVSMVGKITKLRAIWRGWFGGQPYDLALVYHTDEALITYALRIAKHVVAFRQKNAKLNDRLFNCPDTPPFQTMHAAEIPLLLTRSIGAPDAGRQLSYTVARQEDEWARETLQHIKRPLIGLQVASFPTKAYRDWPIEYFETLCERILERWPDAHFLIFGGTLEKDRTDALAKRLGRHATLFAGTLTLRQSAALMNLVDLYIGVDTGPTHIMGALHKPMIALYHCYSPSRVLAPLEHPCCYIIDHPRVGQEDCGPEASMSEISVDVVWAKVVEAFATHHPHATPVSSFEK